MPFTRNIGIKSFEYASRFLKKMGADALKKAQELDRNAKPEYNVIAIPFINQTNSNEEYKSLWEGLYRAEPVINFGVPNVKEGSKRIHFENNKAQLVVGNFSELDELFEKYEQCSFRHSRNLFLKTSKGHALQEISRSMDGIYFDKKNDEKTLNLENIAINTVGGGRILNPTVLVFRNGSQFIYRSSNGTPESERERIDYIGHPTNEYIREVANLCSSLFKFNTLTALNLRKQQ